VLYLAFELSLEKWKIAFATSLGGKQRIRTLEARNLAALQEEIRLAARAFRLPALVPVVCCYEAGRDGFWLHRYLESQNFVNYVVDPASIETSRRGKKPKTDRIDVRKLLTMLIRYHAGEPDVWSVCHVPRVEDEDARHLHRELKALKEERTRQTNRIKGLLIGQGIRIESIPKDFLRWVQRLRLWNGSPLSPVLRIRLEDEYARRALADQQIKRLENEQRRAIREDASEPLDQVRQLMELRGIGEQTAWIAVMEFFGWREFKNRRQLGALAGYTPVPNQSGQQDRDRGISKAGNRYIRALFVELAWRWLQLQPKSELTRWYNRRFGKGGPRQRKVGIVALARKLLIAVWRFLEHGVIPEGALPKEGCG
jgi:transposase